MARSLGRFLETEERGPIDTILKGLLLLLAGLTIGS